MDRLICVTYSPRLPPGLLSQLGWQALAAGPVYGSEPDGPQACAVRAAGVPVRPLVDGGVPGGAQAAAAALLARAGAGGTAVWLPGPDGSPGVTAALHDLVAGRDGTVELSVVPGSWDPPGGRLLDVVAVMDRLRSPGGCPWDAQQTHVSLAPYLVEEAYEAVEAIETSDGALLREELGDLLLQVVFHARVAEEGLDGTGWSIDDVAGDLVDKLVRRHPHVFAGRAVSGAAEVDANWDAIKAVEKQRTSVTDGVPFGQPALALAAALQRRAGRGGLPAAPPPDSGDAGPEAYIGRRLFDLVQQARAAGVDPEAALRRTARAYRDALLDAERAPGGDAHVGSEP